MKIHIGFILHIFSFNMFQVKEVRNVQEQNLSPNFNKENTCKINLNLVND